jgi:hypothetical protein
MEEPAAPQPDPDSGADPIVVEGELTQEDWSAWLAVWTARVRARASPWKTALVILLPLLAGLALSAILSGRFLPLPFFAGVCAYMVAATFSQRLLQDLSRPASNGYFLGRIRMELDAQGMRTVRDHGDAWTRWSAVSGVTRTDTHVFLWVDPISAVILPARWAPNGLDARALAERIHALMDGAAVTVEPAVSVPATLGAASAPPDEAAPGAGFPRSLARRLLWRVGPESGAVSSDAVIACCAAVALAVWLAFDRYQAGEGAEWYLGGAGGVAWYAGGLLFVAWATHRASGREVRFRSVLAALAGALPLVLVLGLSTREWVLPSWQGPCYVLLAAVVGLHLHRALAAAAVGPRRWALPAALLAAALFAWGTSKAWVHPSFWYDAYDGEDADPLADETLLFEQAGRIEEAAAHVAAGRPGRPDVFFLGFAGYGEQKVFAEELKLTEGVVTRRYGAAGRSLLLVNDGRDRETRPLATVPGLRHALARMAERMDPDEDVLFLMLTSHGSDDAELSVSNGSLSLSGLDGPELRDALDASGIRWRVIVISACYSGSFIEPLADDHTIVVTSAAADRTSFGCGDDDVVTEFGAAFIRDALPQAASLAAAFETAKGTVEKRERAAGLEPSSPQGHFGRAIEPVWARVEGAATIEVSRGP